MPSVPEGMLTQEHRDLLILANKERLPVVVGSLHVCYLDKNGNQWRCEDISEPGTGPILKVGVVADWDQRVFRMVTGDLATGWDVPWMSAVGVWRPDQAPPEDALRGIVASRMTGAIHQVHP